MLHDGLYERVIDTELRSQLDRLTREIDTTVLDEGDSNVILARYMQRIVETIFGALPHAGRLQKQVEVANGILDLLRRELPSTVNMLSALTTEKLLEIRAATRPALPRPSAGLVASSLLTGASIDPSLSSLLKQELQSADRVDILCAFVKWSGIRLIENELRSFCSTHDKEPEPALRVITTTYMGATDERAVTALTNLPSTGVRVSYDTHSTRLHAKAYLFHRDSGFSTAYVGSSNISAAALTDGLEWNTRITEAETPHLWQKVVGTFETYWHSAEMVPYYLGDQTRLAHALIREKAGEPGYDDSFRFEIRPYPFQEEVLERLNAERNVHNSWKNLVVAATGTGKTVIAAFDYKRIAQHRRPRMLFVAHREEILQQSRDCFRRILQDYNFGELLVGTHTASEFDHLFVSIQSFNSKRLHEKLPRDYYDYIIVDEFHHAAATSYKVLLDHFRPRILLGLTATPERHDGMDILQWFDGRIAAEMRLGAAINRGLLAPFQYFGVADSVDLTNVKWVHGAYDQAELSRLYDEDKERADLVVREVNAKVLDPRKAMGLGFCVSVRHAHFMAKYFLACGIPAAALSAETADTERKALRKQLIEREINFLFVVDLFNEGVDIPEVDTILFLRPTESLTVFLQQFGRGLRLASNKECLTVLDFIGGANRNFRFDVRFAALTGRRVGSIKGDLDSGIPFLPLGCSIRLEKRAMEHVLNNIKTALDTRNLTARVREFEQETGKQLSLPAFVEHHDVALETIYRAGHDWTWVTNRAFKRNIEQTRVQKAMSSGLGRLIHLDAPAHLKRLLGWLQSLGASTQAHNDEPLLEKSLNMLFASLFGDEPPASRLVAEKHLLENPWVLQELQELLALRLSGVVENPPSVMLPFESALEVHARYSRDELLAGLGAWTLKHQKEVREGVYWNKEQRYDLFFVTLNKVENEYSPTTMYQDYAIDERLFHWQSQSTTTPESATGLRYQQQEPHATTILLAVRDFKAVAGRTAPYWFLGPANYVSHSGSRPMSVVLELHMPIPARLQTTLCRMIRV